jgi:hypothetical protein
VHIGCIRAGLPVESLHHFFSHFQFSETGLVFDTEYDRRMPRARLPAKLRTLLRTGPTVLNPNGASVLFTVYLLGTVMINRSYTDD